MNKNILLELLSYICIWVHVIYDSITTMSYQLSVIAAQLQVVYNSWFLLLILFLTFIFSFRLCFMAIFKNNDFLTACLFKQSFG